MPRRIPTEQVGPMESAAQMRTEMDPMPDFS